MLNGLKNVDYFNFFPSVKLKYLINNAASNLGISVDFGTGSNIDDLLIKLNKKNAGETAVSLTATGNAKNGYTLTSNSLISKVQNRNYTYYASGYKKTDVLVHEFKALVDLTIKVPGSGVLTIVSTTGKVLNTCFQQPPLFQEISWSQNISIKKDEQFAILSKTNYNENSGLWEGNFSANIGTFVFSAFAGSENTVEWGDYYLLLQNLPDVTLIDLVKTFAFLNSKAVRWNEQTKTISFSDFAYSGNGTDLTQKIISIDSLKRSVGDYCQQNIISFNSDKSVLDSNKLKIS